MNERICETVGIDLGTTYSSLAYMGPQNVPRVMCDSSGQTVIPSVVFFDEDEIVVGDVALSQAKVHADRCVQFIKIHMGDNWRKEFNGRQHTPESISALLLGHLVREAEPQLGPIRKVVITVPAYFTEKRRRATQQAGEIAGLEVVGTLNEPMAAALAYGLHQTSKEENALVYDLGGGTFDVTVVKISPNSLVELATNGNRQLGGRDWDQALLDHIADEFKRAHGVDPRESVQAVQDLWIECEKAKRRLSRMARTSLRLHAFGKDHISEVSRETFESLTAHLVQATKLTTELALEDAGLAWGQISRVVLVGGSTHLPAVRQMLKDVSGIAPDTAVNPVVAVALGAAIYASILETGKAVKTIRLITPESTEQVSKHRSTLETDKESPFIELSDSSTPTPAVPRVTFVTAHGVGVKVLQSGQWINRVLIPKNTKVPATVTKRFQTAIERPGSTYPLGPKFLPIRITQGDTPHLDLAEELGVGRIRLPNEEKSGSPVEVTLAFDSQARLHVRAVYVPTNLEMDMTLDVQGGLKQQDVEEYRNFMESTGYISSTFRAALPQDEIRVIDEDDDDNVPIIEPLG